MNLSKADVANILAGLRLLQGYCLGYVVVHNDDLVLNVEMILKDASNREPDLQNIDHLCERINFDA